MNDNISIAAGKTPENWLQVLQEHVAKKDGKSYIVLTAEKNLAAVGEKPKGAQKLKFKEIAAIITKLINSKEVDLDVRKGLQEGLVSLANRVSLKYEGRFWKKESLAIAKQILNVNSEPEISGSSSSTSSASSVNDDDDTAINPFQDLQRILTSENLVVTRSTSGKDGVYFCAANGVKVPLKFIRQPQHIIFADRLFKASGFKTPETQLVPKDVLPIDTKAVLIKRSATPAKKNIASLHSVQMKYLLSNAWEDVTPLDREKALKHTQFGRQIGKMLFLDILIGNTDRLAKGSFNAGNLMVDFDNENDFRDLVLCDNEIHLDETAIQETRAEVLQELLTNPKVLTSYLSALYTDQADMNETDIKKFEKNVATGILEGAQDFLKLCGQGDKLAKIFDTTGLPKELSGLKLCDKIYTYLILSTQMSRFLMISAAQL